MLGMWRGIHISQCQVSRLRIYCSSFTCMLTRPGTFSHSLPQQASPGTSQPLACYFCFLLYCFQLHFRYPHLQNFSTPQVAQDYALKIAVGERTFHVLLGLHA
jgi:hypothetical protein